MLSFMAREFFATSDVLHLPLVALALFVGIFAVVAFRALTIERDEIDALSRLPLRNDARQGTRRENDHG